jgi:hypothetical protein
MEHEGGKWNRLRCPKCGYNDDRDHVAVWNLAKSALVVLGFHYLDTYLGRNVKAYKEAIDALTPALTKALSQSPESGPGVSEEGGEAPSPRTSPKPSGARGDSGEGANEPSSGDAPQNQDRPA